MCSFVASSFSPRLPDLDEMSIRVQEEGLGFLPSLERGSQKLRSARAQEVVGGQAVRNLNAQFADDADLTPRYTENRAEAKRVQRLEAFLSPLVCSVPPYLGKADTSRQSSSILSHTACHTRAVLSQPPETMRLLSGDHATDRTQPECPV